MSSPSLSPSGEKRRWGTIQASTHVFADRHAREGGDALPYKLPITQQKPPGGLPGGLRYSITQRSRSFRELFAVDDVGLDGYDDEEGDAEVAGVGVDGADEDVEGQEAAEQGDYAEALYFSNNKFILIVYDSYIQEGNEGESGLDTEAPVTVTALEGVDESILDMLSASDDEEVNIAKKARLATQKDIRALLKKLKK